MLGILYVRPDSLFITKDSDMKLRHFVFLLALCTVIPLRSQDLSSATWYFGVGAGLSFVSGSPVIITGGQTSCIEGTSVICDSLTGSAIAYSDGATIWRGDHSVAATGVGGNVGSSTMGGLFIRHPGDPSVIYLFTVEQNESPPSQCRITTCSYAGGVLTYGSTQTLFSGVTEKVTSARACNGIDYWVVTKLRNGTFVSYRISATNGFELASRVNSAGGLVCTVDPHARGEMKISPDGRWLAAANEDVGTDLCRFNNATGAVTVVEQIDLGQQRYGLSFSPNSQLLYVNTGWRSSTSNLLYQYDLAAAPIGASRLAAGTFATTGTSPGSMMIAPDGKIYVARNGSDALGCINNPDVRGTGCNYDDRRIIFPSAIVRWGLPNVPQHFFVPRFAGNDTAGCEGSPLRLGIAALPGYTYAWSPSAQFDDPTSAQPTIVVNGTQRYTVIVTDPNGCTINQAVDVVSRPLPVTSMSPDTVVCIGTSASLRATIPVGGTLTWTPTATLSSTNSSPTIATPTVTTTYIATVTDATGCVGVDSVTVTVQVPVKPDLAPTATLDLCPGSSLDLTIGNMPGTVLWSTGATTPSITVSTGGVYSVAVTDALGCVAGDTVTVVMLPKPVAVSSNDTVICAGNATQLRASGGVTYRWTPPDGLDDPTLATVTARPALTTEYFVEVTDANGCKDTTSTVVVLRPLPTPLLTQIDTTICGCDTLVLSAAPGFTTYLWSDGSTTPSITVRDAGSYSVTVTDDLGCTGTSNVVRIDTFTTITQVSTKLLPLSAPDGEHVNVQLTISNWPTLAPCFGDSISWIIEMQSGVLSAETEAGRGVQTDDGLRIVRGVSKWNGTADSVTVSLPYTVTLGDTSQTNIRVLAAQGSKCPGTITGNTASFSVDEICRAGNINRKFLSPERFNGIISAIPNPSSGAVTVRVRLDNQQSYHLEISDVLGQVVMQTTPAAGNGSIDVPIDVGDLPPGKYIITLVAGNVRSGFLLEVL